LRKERESRFKLAPLIVGTAIKITTAITQHFPRTLTELNHAKQQRSKQQEKEEKFNQPMKNSITFSTSTCGPEINITRIPQRWFAGSLTDKTHFTALLTRIDLNGIRLKTKYEH